MRWRFPATSARSKPGCASARKILQLCSRIRFRRDDRHRTSGGRRADNFARRKSWNGDSLASMSIGYEIGVTALQTASAFATIANDGVRAQPAHNQRNQTGRRKDNSCGEPEKTPVVSAETARDLRQMLRKVVFKGTGKRAQLERILVGGENRHRVEI